MDQRLKLHSLLQTMGAKGVYFQPPENIKMVYPAIVYKRDRARTDFAGNNPYIHTKLYQITIIDSDPDSEIPDRVSKLPMCLFSRNFVVDQLNHDVYNIYF